MKKNVLILLAAVLLLTGCDTYTGAGAATGGYFGSIIGSAIGGISDGRRGSDVGALIGMAGGAIVGAVIGNAADEEQARREEDYRRAREERIARRDVRVPMDDESGFDPTNGGDDRIVFDDTPSPTTTTPPAATITPTPSAVNEGLIIRNAQFVDASRDGVLVAGEECKVSFEIMNRTGSIVYDVQPLVYELTGNKYLHISQNLHVESILPGKGIRYTATIKGDRRLREGTARIRVGVALGNREIDGQSQDLTIITRRR